MYTRAKHNTQKTNPLYLDQNMINMIMNAYDVTYNMTMIHDHNLQKNLKADPSVESKSSFFHLSQEN